MGRRLVVLEARSAAIQSLNRRCLVGLAVA
jgi:hypothetical protein